MDASELLLRVRPSTRPDARVYLPCSRMPVESIEKRSCRLSSSPPPPTPAPMVAVLPPHAGWSVPEEIRDRFHAMCRTPGIAVSIMPGQTAFTQNGDICMLAAYGVRHRPAAEVSAPRQ